MTGSSYCIKHPPSKRARSYNSFLCFIVSFLFLLSYGCWFRFQVPVCSALILGTNSDEKKSIVDIPNLATLAPKLHGTQLNYRIAVGDPENPFPIQGLHLELGGNPRTPKRHSTGIHGADLLNAPFYINEKGMQTIQFEQGGWEVTWRRNSPHGHLVCSWVNPERLQRSDSSKQSADNNDSSNDSNSVFPAGRFFVYHRVWTAATLESERERRRGLQARAAACLRERDAQLAKIVSPEQAEKDDNNAFSKLLSYGQAAQSMNRFRTLGLKEAQFVPLFDDQVLELATPSPDDCILVSTRGRIFAAVGGNRRRGQLEYIGGSRVDFFNRDDDKNRSINSRNNK